MNYRIDYWNKKEADPMKFLSIFRCTTEPIGGGTEEDDEGELVDWDAAVIAVDKAKKVAIGEACNYLSKLTRFVCCSDYRIKEIPMFTKTELDAFKKAMENQD